MVQTCGFPSGVVMGGVWELFIFFPAVDKGTAAAEESRMYG